MIGLRVQQMNVVNHTAGHAEGAQHSWFKMGQQLLFHTSSSSAGLFPEVAS